MSDKKPPPATDFVVKNMRLQIDPLRIAIGRNELLLKKCLDQLTLLNRRVKLVIDFQAVDQ